jgi:hypothetical protein
LIQNPVILLDRVWLASKQKVDKLLDYFDFFDFMVEFKLSHKNHFLASFFFFIDLQIFSQASHNNKIFVFFFFLHASFYTQILHFLHTHDHFICLFFSFFLFSAKNFSFFEIRNLNFSCQIFLFLIIFLIFKNYFIRPVFILFHKHLVFIFILFILFILFVLFVLFI